jgi:YYY domain-containing protein
MTDQGAIGSRSGGLGSEGESVGRDLNWRDIGQAIRDLWARLHEITTDRRFVAGALVAILLVGSTLRLVGLDWDDGHHLHPDERYLTMVEVALDWPSSLGEYLDSARNPLNPYNRGYDTYVYGLFPVALTKFLGGLVGKTGYDGIYLVGRAMSGMMDLLTVFLVFIIGRRLYGPRVGLLGALLLSLTVLNIQQAHFFTVDTTTTFFVTLALYFAVRVAQGEGWGSVMGLGVTFGMAVAAKISVLSFLGVIGLAYLLRIMARREDEASSGHTSAEVSVAPSGAARAAAPLVDVQGRLGSLSVSLRVEPHEQSESSGRGEELALRAVQAGMSILVVLILAFFAFRLVQPQAFTGPGLFGLRLNPQWLRDMNWIQRLMSGEIDYPPSHQWAAREPIWYMLRNMVLWGMGLPLGLAAWAGWGIMAYELYRKRRWAHLLPWAWASFTFLYQSVQFVKSIRYLLPIYPVMALLAAYGLASLWRWGQDAARRRPEHRWARRAPALAGGLLGVVVLGTAFWALAFVGIYTRPVTRVEASRWVYRNLPVGSTLSYEVWDDPVPMNMDGYLASNYFRQIRMDLYWEDIPEKREELYGWLEELDYIILTSNRLYESIPRLPMRYPMTTRYYEALFSGELGFDRLATFTSRPRLFGIEIVDDYADETFTVYDHPKVIIFQKRADFSMERVRAMFDVYDLERVVRIKPRQVGMAPNSLMLDDETRAIQQAGGTWSDLFRRDSPANRLPTVTWLAMLFLAGIIAMPLGFVAFRPLRDRGYILSRALGLLLWSYLAWLLASARLLPYTRATIVGVLLALAVASAAVAWTQRRALGDFIRARWRLLLSGELLFLGFFLLFWFIRRGNPDLWHPVMGGEKPMDLAYLNAILRSTYFPAYDPWLAGGYINYYYFGWVLVATPIKLTGIVPTVAYNLAIPTFFAMVATGACSLVYNLVPAGDDEGGWTPRALRYGLVGSFLVALAGNLGQLRLILQGLQMLGQGVQMESSIPGLPALVQTVVGLWATLVRGTALPFRSEWWYWNASRVMQHGEINEFPFFTFLYADLHAHLMAMPLALLALALTVSLALVPAGRLLSAARDGEGRWETLRRMDWAAAWRLSLLGLVLGALWCTNSWDFPTYAVVAVIGLCIGVYGATGRIHQDALSRAGWRIMAVLLLSALLFRPYHAHFGLAYSSVEPWRGETTTLGSYLIIHGVSLFIVGSYLAWMVLRRGPRNALLRAARVHVRYGRRRRVQHLYRLLVRRRSLWYELAWTGLIALGILLLLMVMTGRWIPALVLPLLVIAAMLTLDRRADAAQRLQTALIGLGVALTLAVEYVVIKGDIGRMNTVFKFYLQVWIMWGVVGGAGLYHLARTRWRRAEKWQSVWRTTLALLLAAAALYPVFGTWGKVRDRWDPSLPAGLDGTRYMTTATYFDQERPLTLEHDRRAIVWLQDNIQGSPVIAEANTPLYRWGSRISVYTGLPTIVGWDWHQKQQRAALDGAIIDWRLQDVRDLYNSTDVELTRRILARYDVRYVYVGELEQAYYAPEGLAKLENMVGSALDIVYREGPVTIYRVRIDVSAAATPAEDTPRRGLAAFWDGISRQWIGGAVRADGPQDEPPTGLMLDGPVDELPVVADRGWNRLATDSAPLAAALWWLTLTVVGLAAWPLASHLLPHFRDGGYGLSRGIGLLLVGYFVWMGASLRVVAFTALAAWGAMLALAVISFFYRRRPEQGAGGWARSGGAGGG